MTTATIESEVYGKIEVKRCNTQGTFAGVAYFFGQDFETNVDTEGRFSDVAGVEFVISWPHHKDGEAVLTAYAPRTIGRVTVAN